MTTSDEKKTFSRQGKKTTPPREQEAYTCFAKPGLLTMLFQHPKTSSSMSVAGKRFSNADCRPPFCRFFWHLAAPISFFWLQLGQRAESLHPLPRDSRSELHQWLCQNVASFAKLFLFFLSLKALVLCCLLWPARQQSPSAKIVSCFAATFFQK